MSASYKSTLAKYPFLAIDTRNSAFLSPMASPLSLSSSSTPPIPVMNVLVLGMAFISAEYLEQVRVMASTSNAVVRDRSRLLALQSLFDRSAQQREVVPEFTVSSFMDNESLRNSYVFKHVKKMVHSPVMQTTRCSRPEERI